MSSFNETRLEKIYLLDQKKNEYLTSSRILLSLKWGVNQHVDEYIARLAESGVTLSDEIKQLEMEVKHLNDKFLRIAAISNGLFSGELPNRNWPEFGLLLVVNVFWSDVNNFILHFLNRCLRKNGR